ncbi:tetratricopeptide repeat protein [Flavobacterium sp. 20NA77.7]|uniref:Tetratricopeptide repeat protein n=1 Tax=Flavobacterium nakdongensis TaxID=3073563 RepID=A0ABY9RCX6_9FLAO|nr:tetratricopeptide repeat protein [Flavobacterium sp. 20NA77.7]WMW78703.1 tetratricopeptide repeat protein [Flavobacterium sp. 20NA77.7]
MKSQFLTFFLFISLFASSQDKLIFNKKFTECEDKWVAFTSDSLGYHSFGFIYIDEQAGLTLDYSGSFKIDANGKIILEKKDIKGAMKYRLQPNSVKVSIVPESFYKDLQIEAVPEWLKFYKTNENSIERLYKWGYMYNGWNECQTALTFLEKAYKINPNFKDLKVELGFSYNCLSNFEKAIVILKSALVEAPTSAYIYKELLYAQIHNGQLEDAINTYDKIINEITDKTYNGENAFNILGEYFRQKNIEKFNQWIKKTSIDKDSRFIKYIEQMKYELNKK